MHTHKYTRAIVLLCVLIFTVFNNDCVPANDDADDGSMVIITPEGLTNYYYYYARADKPTKSKNRAEFQ